MKKRKLNVKPGCEQEIKEDQFPVTFHCACVANKIPMDARPLPPPEELCSVCRPLGPAPDWQNADRKNLPYNMRNYQIKVVEFLKRVQLYGVETYEHVKKPQLFTGSWMEYVRSLDDMML